MRLQMVFKNVKKILENFETRSSDLRSEIQREVCSTRVHHNLWPNSLIGGKYHRIRAHALDSARICARGGRDCHCLFRERRKVHLMCVKK